ASTSRTASKFLVLDRLPKDNILVFRVKERDDQHQNAKRNEQDRLRDRRQVRDVIEKELYQRYGEQNYGADPQVLFAPLDADRDQNERIDAPEDAQAKLGGLRQAVLRHQVNEFEAGENKN